MMHFKTTVKDDKKRTWTVFCEVDGKFDSLDGRRMAGSPMKVTDLKIEHIRFVRKISETNKAVSCFQSLAHVDDMFPQKELNKIEKQAADYLLDEFNRFMEDCYPRK